jgi:hypothetical protein
VTALAGVLLLIADGWWVYVANGVQTGPDFLVASIVALIGGGIVGTAIR